MKKILTQSRLKELLHYDENTGFFTWTGARKRCDKPGKRAGSDHHSGYRIITVDQVFYSEHRLVFLYMTGNLPSKDVDHINGIKNDNRWINLRDVCKSLNQKYRSKPNANSKTGELGVSFAKGVYSAWIGDKNKRIYVGQSKNKLQAKNMYLLAKERMISTL